MRRPWWLWLRSPVAYWAFAVLLAIVTVTTVELQRRSLDRREHALGPTTVVAVAVADIAAGGRLRPDDVELRRVPRSIVPDDALRSVPPDARVRTDIAAGEVIIDRRLTPGPTSATAAAIPAGWRALAVPLPPGGLHLVAGDRVDLLSLTSEGASTVIVTDGVVLDADQDGATVAVPSADAPTVADAALAATLTISLSGPEP